MTQKDFNQLSKLERMALLNLEGTYLASREQNQYKIYLFGLRSWYVELFLMPKHSRCCGSKFSQTQVY